MKVSLNTVKKLTGLELPPVDELVEKINRQLGGVEEVTDLGKRYEGAVIAKVVNCVKHPDADKLSVCEIDAGTGENVQVVCGAPNVREGLMVVWLQPGAVVPETAGDAEPFVLGARELRGVMSNGMLASAKELGLGDDHSGIVEINDPWVPSGEEIKPGASFAKVFGMDDVIINIENKMFTHRPDLFGQLGVAREIAGIMHEKFTNPSWYELPLQTVESSSLELEVTNNAFEKVPRFMAVAMSNVEVKPSPLWLQCALVAMGGKPINNIVDATNYVMLMTAQPTHAYDYDKLRGHKLSVRMASAGEQVPLLNGKTYVLTEDDIVIEDGEGAVGLGGIMGGGNSEVSSETKNIVLEVANFDMYAVRKSSMRHGLFTDALTRFNKGQSPLQNPYVISNLMKWIADLAGGEQATDVKDVHAGLPEKRAVQASTQFINERLGFDLSANEIEVLLGNVDIAVDAESEDVHWYKAPFWRTDIELPEDVVEEVGRLYGFDRLPLELPMRSMAPSAKNQAVALKQDIRTQLSTAGANEVLTYSFVHENVLKKAGQDAAFAYKLSNALSPDLQCYRLSIVPSLLDKVHMNQKAGHGFFALFELGKTHFKDEMDAIESAVPNEDSHLGFVVTANQKEAPQGSAYYQAKQYLEMLVDITKLEFIPLKDAVVEDEQGRQLVAMYNKNRSAILVQNGQIWGIVGEFSATVQRNFKLPNYSAGFELKLNGIAKYKKEKTYTPLSRFPGISRDISLRVQDTVAFADVWGAVKEATMSSESRLYELIPMGIYRADGSDKKTITLRLKVVDYERTLTDEDAAIDVTRIVSLTSTRNGATQV